MRRDYSAEGMEDIFLRLDRLHDVAANGEADRACDSPFAALEF